MFQCSSCFVNDSFKAFSISQIRPPIIVNLHSPGSFEPAQHLKIFSSLNHSLEMKTVQKSLSKKKKKIWQQFGRQWLLSRLTHSQTTENPIGKKKCLRWGIFTKSKSLCWKVWNGGETGKVLFCSLADMRFLLSLKSFTFFRTVHFWKLQKQSLPFPKCESQTLRRNLPWIRPPPVQLWRWGSEYPVLVQFVPSKSEYLHEWRWVLTWDVWTGLAFIRIQIWGIWQVSKANVRFSVWSTKHISTRVETNAAVDPNTEHFGLVRPKCREYLGSSIVEIHGYSQKKSLSMSFSMSFHHHIYTFYKIINTI